jgi:hypothetical protein
MQEINYSSQDEKISKQSKCVHSPRYVNNIKPVDGRSYYWRCAYCGYLGMTYLGKSNLIILVGDKNEKPKTVPSDVS